jgi:hypothetical protein
MAAAAASLFDNFCLLDMKLGAVCLNSNSDVFPRAFPVINSSTTTPKPTVPLLVRRAG